MASIVLGVFSDRGDAEEAISELEEKGYNPKDMSIMMKDRYEARALQENTGAGEVVGGTLGGATTGAVLGGLAGLVASFAIPGLGAFFIGGPVAAALGLSGAAATTASGAATGALAGGILGALMSTFNLSREDATIYENRINEGGILVAVPTRMGDEQEVREILSDKNADNTKTVESVERTLRKEEMPSMEYGPTYFSEVRKRGKKRRLA